MPARLSDLLWGPADHHPEGPIRKHGLDAFGAVAGHCLSVQQGRRDGPAKFAQPDQSREPDQLAAGTAEGVDGALVVPVRGVAEPARVF
jgi:hypothetical protein